MPLPELLRKYFAEYGYWTVAVVLLLENAGVPVPGETTLLFAAFLAFSEHKLTLWGITIVSVIANDSGIATETIRVPRMLCRKSSMTSAMRTSA